MKFTILSLLSVLLLTGCGSDNKTAPAPNILSSELVIQKEIGPGELAVLVDQNKSNMLTTRVGMEVEDRRVDRSKKSDSSWCENVVTYKLRVVDIRGAVVTVQQDFKRERKAHNTECTRVGMIASRSKTVDIDLLETLRRTELSDVANRLAANMDKKKIYIGSYQGKEVVVIDTNFPKGFGDGHTDFYKHRYIYDISASALGFQLHFSSEQKDASGRVVFDENWSSQVIR